MGSECIHCEGFGVCDLFLKKDAKSYEKRLECEEHHRNKRKVVKRHSVMKSQVEAENEEI